MIELGCFIDRLGSHTRSIISVSCQSSEGLNDVNRVSTQALAYTVRGSYLCGSVQRRNPAGICAARVATYGENVVEYDSHAHATDDKVGVLLLNLGGPDTLHDVQPFLFNLFADPVCWILLFHPRLCNFVIVVLYFISVCLKYRVMLMIIVFYTGHYTSSQAFSVSSMALGKIDFCGTGSQK